MHEVDNVKLEGKIFGDNNVVDMWRQAENVVLASVIVSDYCHLYGSLQAEHTRYGQIQIGLKFVRALFSPSSIN